MITVITGPPCSGKTTYARQHAKPGDLILDRDHLAQALGSPGSHQHPDWLRDIAAAAWSAAVEAATSQYPGRRAWIVDSRPTRHRWQAYGTAKARIVRLTATAEELHRRARADGRTGECHQRIDDYLRTADPKVSARTQW